MWVVGLSKDSEADRAGIQQGDQILQVTGLEGGEGKVRGDGVQLGMVVSVWGGG